MTEISLPPPGSRHPSVKGSLTTSTISNFLWMFSGAGTEAVLKIVVLSVLARLLVPADFGVVSAALSVISLAELFARSGVAPAIVQAPALTEADIRTAFTMTVIGAVLVSLVVYVCSGLIAGLFNMPSLEQYVAVLSVVFLLRGFGLVSEALLQRHRRFRILATTSLASYVVGFAGVALFLSWLGMGAWALVYGNIAQAAMVCVLLNIYGRHSFRPAMVKSSFWRLLNFGAGVTLTRFGNHVALHVDYFIVGRWLGAEALGFYSRAYLLFWQPAQIVGTIGDRVMFPAMASIQDSKERIARALNRTMGLCAFTQFPVAVVLIVIAPEVIHLLLGSGWDAAILPFQILVSVLVFRTAHKFIGTTLRATGDVYMQAAWQWSYAATVVIAAIFGTASGIVGVAIGVSAAIFISFWIGLVIVGMRNHIPLRPTLMVILRHGALSAILLAILVALKYALLPLHLPEIAMMAAICGVTGMMIMAIVFLAPSILGEEGKWVWEHLLSRVKLKVLSRGD